MTEMTHYTKSLFEKGKERKRLSKQLAQLVATVAEEITLILNEGAKAYVEGVGWLEVIRRESNLDTAYYLALKDEYEYRVFNSQTPDSEYYLHGDLRCLIRSATRDEYLAFANHLPHIIDAFKAGQQDIINALREAFDVLRAVVEAKPDTK